jgi:hypothetical protein
VPEVGCREGFGKHVGRLHKLEGRLLGGREIVAARGDHEVVGVPVALRPFPAWLQHLPRRLGQSPNLGAWLFISVQGAHEQVENKQLRGVGLGRRDALLLARAQ